MFVEDGRLIVHIGDDWYYFEKQGENVAIENPWTESDEKGVLEATGYNVKAPEDATEVHYSFCADEKMAQVTYQKETTDVSHKTYETETFDGTVIKIDETNIISQEKVEDVLETTLVPSDAEVIAPGRDFVYLADADNYYVEDKVNFF